MTADAPVTVAWLAPERPDAEQSRVLVGWARAHGVKLSFPRDEKPPALLVDTRATKDRSEDIEKILDRVRDAIAARDAEATDRGLAAAESELRAHPELPQAAWLMAEVERARSSRFRRVPPLDEEAADRAWMRAEALDGGRVPGVSERAAAAHPAEASVALDPLPAVAVLRFDGRPQPARSALVATHAGSHALVVTWDDTPVWAGWIETPPGSSTLHLAIPSPPPCSSGDLGLARLGSGGMVDATDVRCASWVTVLAGSRPSSVLVAVCAEDRCGALLEWEAPGPDRWRRSPPPERSRSTWPSWATWGLVGAGAAIVTGVVLVASGVFQAPATETRFVGGGVKTQ